MPEVWFFGGILLLIFLVFWTAIEIGIKWVVLDHMLSWESAWRSLVSSVVLQLLQTPGIVLAWVLSDQNLKSGTTPGSGSDVTLLFLLVFVGFRLIIDILIGGVFLMVVKRNPELAWRASVVSSFPGAISLALLFMIISTH